MLRPSISKLIINTSLAISLALGIVPIGVSVAKAQTETSHAMGTDNQVEDDTLDVEPSSSAGSVQAAPDSAFDYENTGLPESAAESRQPVIGEDAKDLKQQDSPEQHLDNAHEFEKFAHAVNEMDSSVSQLENLHERFNDAYASYKHEDNVLLELQNEHASIEGKISRFTDEVQHAHAVIDAANEELAAIEGGRFTRFVLSLIRPSDFDSQLYLLHTLVDNRKELVVSSSAAASGLERKKEELDYAMREQGVSRRVALDRVNARASEIEGFCSMIRQQIHDLPWESDTEGGQDIQAALNSVYTCVAEAESRLSAWYAETNAISGAGPGLSFGEGADFAMSQTMFVEKWGSAIDAFYADYAIENGEVALQGCGKTIATAAYQHRIDPRLCAAVSIAESSGGRACIKPYNAWGWGAVDSDPYANAASWSSWGEAIEEWHKGMAGSKTGLANARTVSILAEVYCSSPGWGVTVADAMRAISEHAV